MLALLDVTHAVREDRPTEALVARARTMFMTCAAESHEARWMTEDAGIDAS